MIMWILHMLLMIEDFSFRWHLGSLMASFMLKVPAAAFDDKSFSLWGSGEWWMLLAAQSMAIGTVMVRWVSKYSDPVMATGWVSYFVVFLVNFLSTICCSCWARVWYFVHCLLSTFQIHILCEPCKS